MRHLIAYLRQMARAALIAVLGAIAGTITGFLAGALIDWTLLLIEGRTGGFAIVAIFGALAGMPTGAIVARRLWQKISARKPTG